MTRDRPILQVLASGAAELGMSETAPLSHTIVAAGSEPSRQCRVWLGREPATDGEADGLELLSPEERERMAGFHFASDRWLYAAAHVLLRRALSRFAPGTAPAEWRFSVGRYGRPEIAAPERHQDLRFSLSHTRGLAACIVTRRFACGIDVESLDCALDVWGLARHVLAQTEHHRVGRLRRRAAPLPRRSALSAGLQS